MVFLFFREDIEANRLGSPPTFKLLQTMQPDYWFSAHLHCQFAAIVPHEGGKETKFLALDKCLPKRRHLQIVDVPSEFDGDKRLKHDPEWLAILKSTNHLLSVKNMVCHMPGPYSSGERYIFNLAYPKVRWQCPARYIHISMKLPWSRGTKPHG